MNELQVVVKFVKEHPIPLVMLAIGFIVEDYLNEKEEE